MSGKRVKLFFLVSLCNSKFSSSIENTHQYLRSGGLDNFGTKAVATDDQIAAENIRALNNFVALFFPMLVGRVHVDEDGFVVRYLRLFVHTCA